MKRQFIISLSFLMILISCKEKDNSTELLIQAQNERIDSLLQRTTALEKEQVNKEVSFHNTDKAIVHDSPSIKQNKFVVSKITCVVGVPEYRAVETEPPIYDGPITDVKTMELSEKLRKQRNSNLHEIIYVPKTIVFYSEIKEVTAFNEEKKYRFLDNAVSSLRRKNENVQNILKRECLVYASYPEASKALEDIEQNNNP
jgi:hypothetical protein